MNYLETLVHQWLDYRGYFVRRNVNVGRANNAGHSGELDIAAYDPTTGHCLHVECSLDSGSWEAREKRFAPKFRKGKEFLEKEAFPLRVKTIDQWAVVWNAGANRKTLGGGKVVTLATLLRNIATDILETNKHANRTVPEKYFLLRAVQDTMRHVGDPREFDAKLFEDDHLLPKLVKQPADPE